MSLAALGAAGVVAGRRPRRGRPACGIGRGPVPRRSCSSRRPASRSPGSSSRRCSARRGSRASRRTTPGRSGCRRRRRSTSSRGSTSRSSRRPRTPSYPPLSRSSTPPPSTRWAARTWSPCTSSSGSSSSAPSAAVAGCLHRHAPAWLLWPSLLLVLVVPRFGERLLTPQADVLVDVFFVVAALLVALWLRDPAGGGSPRPRCCSPARRSRSARASSSRRASLVVAFVVSRPRRLAAAGASRRSPWASSRAISLAPVVPPTRHPRGTRRRRRSGGGDRCADALRLSFEVLYDNALWSVVPTRRDDRARRRRGLGRPAARRVRRARLALLLFAGGVWSTSASRSCRSPRTSPATRSCATRGRSSCSPAVARPCSCPRSGDGARGEP